MKILSFDIGIKHFAWCLLSYEDPLDTPFQWPQVHILDWQVVNLYDFGPVTLPSLEEVPKPKGRKRKVPTPSPVEAHTQHLVWTLEAQYPHWLSGGTLDYVVIENQNPKAPMNWACQAALLTYLWSHPLSTKVLGVSATLKYKVVLPDGKTIDDWVRLTAKRPLALDQKISQKRRKKGVHPACSSVIALGIQHSEHVDWWTQARHMYLLKAEQDKFDDLADTLFQAAAFIQKEQSTRQCPTNKVPKRASQKP